MARRRPARVLPLLRGPRQWMGARVLPPPDRASLATLALPPQPDRPLQLGSDARTRSDLAADTTHPASLPISTSVRHHLRQEPSAVIPLAGICGGGHGQPRFLLRRLLFLRRQLPPAATVPRNRRKVLGRSADPSDTTPNGSRDPLGPRPADLFPTFPPTRDAGSQPHAIFVCGGRPSGVPAPLFAKEGARTGRRSGRALPRFRDAAWSLLACPAILSRSLFEPRGR